MEWDTLPSSVRTVQLFVGKNCVGLFVQTSQTIVETHAVPGVWSVQCILRGLQHMHVQFCFVLLV